MNVFEWGGILGRIQIVWSSPLLLGINWSGTHDGCSAVQEQTSAPISFGLIPKNISTSQNGQAKLGLQQVGRRWRKNRLFMLVYVSSMTWNLCILKPSIPTDNIHIETCVDFTLGYKIIHCLRPHKPANHYWSRIPHHTTTYHVSNREVKYTIHREKIINTIFDTRLLRTAARHPRELTLAFLTRKLWVRWYSSK